MARFVSQAVTDYESSKASLRSATLERGTRRVRTASIDVPLGPIAGGDLFEFMLVSAHDVPIGLKLFASTELFMDTCDFGVRVPVPGQEAQQISATADACLASNLPLAGTWIPESGENLDILGYGAGAAAHDPLRMGEPFWQLAGVGAEPTPGTAYTLVLVVDPLDSGSNPKIGLQLEYVEGA